MEKLDTTEVAERAGEFVEEVIERSGLDLDARVNVEEEETIRIELNGEDSELVLADSARLLYAINHLVNQIFYRQARNGCSFILDCEHYRGDRAAELELMARKAAERVRLTGKSVILQPMPSSERRIIHLALAEEPGIRTESEGSGRYRHVQIVPE
ncbi:MAG: R3H domain-containing nucleic acid-binding protein [Acidobacteriota bacterium]|jgi:spoIIIJ-associated protein